MASRVVRKGGLEPPRYCYRQPLKLVRLPIPPLPRGGKLYFAGAGAGVCAGADSTGAGVAGAAGAGDVLFAGRGAAGLGRLPTTDPGPRWPRMPSVNAPMTNRIAQIVVARDSTVAPLRAPKAA